VRVVVEETVVTRYFLDVDEHEPIDAAMVANDMVGRTCDLAHLRQELSSRELAFEVWRAKEKIAEFDATELPKRAIPR
jgi:hypothetical protein